VVSAEGNSEEGEGETMNFVEAVKAMSNGAKVMKRMWAPGHWITWDATNSAFVDDRGTRLSGFHPSDILSDWEEWKKLKPCPFCGGRRCD